MTSTTVYVLQRRIALTKQGIVKCDDCTILVRVLASLFNALILSGELMPALPSQYAVRAWIRQEMERRGLVWELWGARVQAMDLLNKALDECSFRDINKAGHVQILADGVRVFHANMMTNVGLRAFDSSDTYNSMAVTKLL